MKKKFLFLALALTLAFSGCANEPVASPIILEGESIEGFDKEEIKVDNSIESSEETPATQEGQEETPGPDEETPMAAGGEFNPIKERETINGMKQSYLTGEWKAEDVVNRRNIAVMIPNNSRAGYNESSPILNQYGLTQASIIYEAPVEGRITRLMGIFEDYDNLDKIGPIRSSRDYYIYQAMSFDSIYVNWGLARPWVEELINSDRIDNISASVAGIYNGYDAAFFRDTTQLKGAASEFTGYLKVSKLADGIKARGYETNYRSTFEQAFLFANDCRATYDSFPDATSIWPGGKGKNSGGYGNYSESNPHFEYNADDQLYYRYQYGREMIDSYNNEQVAVSNVVFKICHGEERLPDDPHYDYLAFGIHGTGDCVVFTNGKVIKGTWKKAKDKNADYFYDENGNEIVLNQGKTWMCCIWKEYSQYMEY